MGLGGTVASVSGTLTGQRVSRMEVAGKTALCCKMESGGGPGMSY